MPKLKLQTSTIRPGFLVSLKTRVIGNVDYNKTELEPDHVTKKGERRARWETERVISDPKEHEKALSVRLAARTAVTRVCIHSAFGLICTEERVDELADAIREARALADKFNVKAKLTQVDVYVIAGRVASDDVEAVRAITNEVKDLMGEMERGVKNADATVIREAAAKARGIGKMLSDAAAEKVRAAVDAARAAAKEIVKAGEGAAVEVDREAVRAIRAARTAFIDVGSTVLEVQKPKKRARSVEVPAAHAGA